MTTATADRPATNLEVRKLHPQIGAEIRGVDLTGPIGDATFADIRHAIGQHGMLVFRNQPGFTGEQQLEFAARFGEVAERLIPPKQETRDRAVQWKHLMLISDKMDEEGKPIGSLGHGEMWFHTDKCYVERPHRFSFLYGIECPTIGGNTRFTSLYSAYDNMPKKYKERFRDTFVMQGQQYDVGRRIDITAPLDTIHHYRQPMFVKNPDSGKTALYVAAQNTMWIEGVEAGESEKILEELFSYTEDPANTYEHVWQVNDLIMWDNLACLHARTDWPKEQTRLLRRCTVLGDRLWQPEG
ncbi:MAG: TauD/TfdA family dioxygenase [Hyphomicrobiales bacterium]|nr:TauD/TfdA family dioxygenase [Hyphomicrobiales bacterium]